jgi:hypothetical protein
MSRIIVPRRGRHLAEDFNTIRPEDSFDMAHAKLESWIAKNLGTELCKLYPYREWAVRVDLKGGMAVIQCLDVSKISGYHLKLDATMNTLIGRMKAIGGEILERGRMTRGRTSEENVESEERTFKDEVKKLDNG